MTGRKGRWNIVGRDDGGTQPLENLGGVTLSWQDLSVYAAPQGREKGYKRLVEYVRGSANPGELTAILGASGAGKSTLMTALAFRAGPGFFTEGEIRANGALVDSSYMMRHSGYMHQEDLFVETMTVLEHLWFMARVKLPGRPERSRASEIAETVDRLLRDVGLGDRADARIGGQGIDDKVLSGGEKKRLAFATELLTDPRILFLDEPTTGQDSHSAAVIVSLLSGFARKGRTVLCTIHQPSSAIFDSFDRIILLAAGRVAFTGTTDRAIDFFASQGYRCPRNYNPADFLIASLAGGAGTGDGDGLAPRICDAFRAVDSDSEVDPPSEMDYRSSVLAVDRRPKLLSTKTPSSEEPAGYRRLCWLTYRAFLQIIRDPSVQIIRIFQKVSVATIAGLCFMGAVKLDQLGIQAAQGVIFILVSENAFFPMYATLALIPQELPLLRREYRAGMYPVHLYYLARMLSLVPGLLLEPLLFTSILYWLAGLRNSLEAFALTLLVVLLTINVSTACGCFFSVLFNSVPLAMAYLVPFDYILMITMGPFVKLGSLPIYLGWIKHVSWLLHASEALNIIQWKDVRNISCEAADFDLPCITEGSQVLRRFDFDESNLWRDMALMVATYLVFHLLAYACLWNRCRSK